MLFDANHALLQTEIPELPAPKTGKVRDVFDLGDCILFVATDRISAFDCVMPNGIPGKGCFLTQISLNWFKRLNFMPNHLITADVEKYPAFLQPYKETLRGRSMLVKKLKMVPVECIARGYICGSGWADYQATGIVCGNQLRPGYKKAEKLDEPIFTPTSKEESGHDQPRTFDQLADLIGLELTTKLRDATLSLYKAAADFAITRGIIIADTKFEFGLDENGQLVLADEVLTPDSSRFWPVESYVTGQNPPSLDKQFVRDWLDSIHFNHQPPAPALPQDVIEQTREKYSQAQQKLQD